MATDSRALTCPFCLAVMASDAEPFVFLRVRAIMHLERCERRGALILSDDVLRSVDDCIEHWMTGAIDRRELDPVTYGRQSTPAEVLILPD